ncbi:hypothetical protein K5K75_001467 [Campylobacter coli]|nr:hypothetical protein [Campylobacter coli]
MVIDNKPKPDVEAPLSNHKDSTKTITQVITYQADTDVTIVADNIDSVKIVASNMNRLLDNTNEFNTNYDSLATDQIYQSNTKTGLQIIDEALTLNNDGTLVSISNISPIKNEIVNVSNVKDDILAVNGIKDNIQSVIDNINAILDCSAMTDDIVIVSGLSAEISEVIQYKNELIQIRANLERLLTIFDYLPELLKNSRWVSIYEDLKNSKGFTDSEYYDLQKLISDNINDLKLISTNVEDIKTLVKIIQDAPDVIQRAIAELDTAVKNYTQKLQDLYDKLSNDLVSTIKTEEVKYKELVVQIQDLSIKINEALLLQKETDIQLKQAILDAKTEINTLKAEVNQLTADYTKFRDEVEQYTKAKILEVIKATIPAVFKDYDLEGIELLKPYGN